jgi:alkylation response protein AidB-like acyl-CoA dehydrogenase
MYLEPGLEQTALRVRVRTFAESTVRPLAAEIDRLHRYPAEVIQGASELGLMGLLVPPHYGGAGLDHLAFTLCIEELARACASTAVIVDVHNSVATEPILIYGSEPQKQAWLPRLAAGEVLGAFALTEPMSGSDAAALRTAASRQRGGWVLRGTKTFITNIGQAGLYIVFARSGPGENAAGLSAFLVPAGTPGVRVGQTFDKMGLNGSPTGELVLDGAFVPDEGLLHEEGRGFAVAMRALDAGRIGISGQALGIAGAAVDEAVAWAREVEGPEPAHGGLLAEMATRLGAARQLAYHAAALCSAGKPFTREAAMAKLFCTDAAMEIADLALQLAGEHGSLEGHPLERHFRDAKALQIYEGTNQVQRLVIARDLLRS